MAYEKNKKATATLQQIGIDNFKKYDKKNKKKKAKKKKAKTKKGNMKQHEKHHSKKHMNVMKKFMSGGMSMDKAHNLATRMIGK
jgi:hypothetical protein